SGARRLAAVLFLSLGVAALPRPAGAQTASGGLAGRVVDEKKSALPGVSVAATDRATGFSRVPGTGKDGALRLSGLPVGVYTVVAELSGYATVTVAEVKVSVATERALEVTMTPAKVAETITVVDEAPLVQTSPAVGAVVSQRELENLPLNGRQ